jgi:hypothetical protein
MMGLAEELMTPRSQSENPQEAPCGFSFGPAVFVVSVQPLANAVANHTCRNRNQKIDDDVHDLTSFPLKEVRQRLQYIIK